LAETGEAQLAHLQNEDGIAVIIEDAEEVRDAVGFAGQRNLRSHVCLAQGPSVGAVLADRVFEAPGAAQKGVRAVLEGLDLTSLDLIDPAIRATVTSLNVGGNSLDALEVPLRSNLRQLTLSGNPLTSPPALWGCPNMLVLDLAYSPAPGLRAVHLAPLPRLRVLRLDGWGLSSLMDPLDPGMSLLAFVRCLRVLSLAENELADVPTVAAGVKGLASLEELDLRENPVASSARYKEGLRAAVPTLRVLDGQSLDTTGVVRSLQEIKGLREQVERNATLLDENMELEVDAALKGKRDIGVIR
jgi:hypothetical protein